MHCIEMQKARSGRLRATMRLTNPTSCTLPSGKSRPQSRKIPGGSGNGKRRPSPRERARFQLRQLHNLLLLQESASNDKERVEAGEAVCRRARAFLTAFCGLHARRCG